MAQQLLDQTTHLAPVQRAAVHHPRRPTPTNCRDKNGHDIGAFPVNTGLTHPRHAAGWYLASSSMAYQALRSTATDSFPGFAIAWLA